jgi:hypothetical protein
MMKELKLRNDGQYCFQSNAYYDDADGTETMAVIFHEDDLAKIVGYEVMERLRAGKEIQFRLVEVQG